MKLHFTIFMISPEKSVDEVSLFFFWRENFSVFFCLISSIYTKHQQQQQQQQFRPNCFIFYFVYSYKQNINIMFIIIIGWLVNYVSCIVIVMFVLLLYDEIGYNIYISCQFDIKKCARKIALFSVFFCSKRIFLLSNVFFLSNLFNHIYICIATTSDHQTQQQKKKSIHQPILFDFHFNQKFFFLLVYGQRA